ncbi:MAG: peptidoglycan-binding domain-containing protein [Patescibacteria group bacterium]
MFTLKVFYSIVIVVSLVVLSPQISFGAEQFSRDLSFGFQQDSDVTKLQEFLSDEGLYSGPITGNFFSLTLKAVKTFQAREGIMPVAGYFGPKTRVRANALLGAQVQASNQQAVAETGTNMPSTSASSTAQLQLETLLKQLALLQSQLATQQQTNQAIQNLQTQQQQQQQTLQQIQQNTTPPITVVVQPTPAFPTPAPITAPTSTPPTLSEVDINTLLSRYFFTKIGDTKASFFVDYATQLKKVTASLDGINYTESYNSLLTNLQRNKDYTLYLRVETADRYAKTTIPFKTKLGFKVSVGSRATGGWPSQFWLTAESHDVQYPIELKSVKFSVIGPRYTIPYTYRLVGGPSDAASGLFDITITAEQLPGCTPATCTGGMYAINTAGADLAIKEVDVPINRTVNVLKDQYGYSYERFNGTVLTDPIAPFAPEVTSYTFIYNGQEYTYSRSDFSL